MQIPLYQLDAFVTDRPFTGNPAAVCPLDAWLPDAVMQAIAAENNLSETAFFVPDGDDYGLRWFTPTTEVDLCGHATLASASVVFRLAPERREVRFRTREAGVLTVVRDGDLLAMDFPARPPAPCAMPPGFAEALGRRPKLLLAARDYLAVYDTAEEVAELAPDFAAIAALDRFAVIVTAPGERGVDFVSRFFAPAKGVDEDPVTGSAHCTLIPYWAERLGKTRLEARQVSRRGGALSCALDGGRVTIAGRAALYLSGTISLQETGAADAV
ncbi:MAG TPA: PhzF family phenazine biosynthesis protein [Stellaceae bacterium]|nr:PhzF family phenazine biosynthesis protein [Stellaceae bacterium]